jgi:predicted glycoside hydrolase/deacetylase ChbG (UPF0249 family)
MAAGLPNRLLGYPADARCLILNADDLGMCHPVNEAIFRLQGRRGDSTSLMVPCPGASRHEYAARDLKSHLAFT